MVHLTPAEFAIRQFGGAQPLSRIVHQSNLKLAFKWKRSRERGGTGGLIPAKYFAPILDAGKLRGIDITPNDLIYGRSIEDAEITVRVRLIRKHVPLPPLPFA